MQGQWTGKYAGSNTGKITLDLDDRGDHFAGYAYLVDDDLNYPSSYAEITTSNKGSAFRLKARVFAVNPQTGDPINWPAVSNQYPGFSFPTEADVDVQWHDTSLSLKWITNIGTNGAARLTKSAALQASEYPATSMTWEEFKQYVGALEPRKYMFRGQEQPWRLRTTFHRMKRADLFRFLREDIPALHRVLSSRTRHIYDLNNPDQNGSFRHLIQHHGYPTPLLDWTYSPFVAVYFAYRKISAPVHLKPMESPKVRIFEFDQSEWRKHMPQVRTFAAHIPHFSIWDFLAIDNDRVVPQQALSAATNVDDIESFIRWVESHQNRTYLRIIDLPVAERSKVVADLQLMGITAGSLFPGIDGACEEIKERLFPSLDG